MGPSCSGGFSPRSPSWWLPGPGRPRLTSTFALRCWGTCVYLVRVDQVSAERGVILLKSVELLKGKGEPSLRADPRAKLVIGPTVAGARVILDWAAEGRTAVLFIK